MVRGMGGELRRVMITKVVENTYYAELIIQRGDEVISVDARPSDSIAIALRMSASIYTTDDLLEHTSIEIAEHSDESDDFIAGTEPEEQKGPGSLSPDELREYLRRMNPEDFGRFNP